MTGVSMPRAIEVTEASSADNHRGLLAYVRARFETFDVDGICVRRTLRNRLAISYPSRQARSGEQFPHFLPTDPTWRRRFEEAILVAYRREVGVP